MNVFNQYLYTSTTKEGYLTKEGRNFKTLKLRWFVLSGNQLIYYENNKKTKKKGELTLTHDTKVSYIENIKGEGMMYIKTPKRTLFLFGKLDEIKDWKIAFESIIYIHKYAEQLNDVLNELFRGKDEAQYLDILIRLCIKYSCEEQTVRRLLWCLGFTDDGSLIQKNMIYSILMRFQPIIREDEIIMFKPYGFNLSSITNLLSKEWFSGFEKESEVIKRFNDKPNGTFCVTFSESYANLFILYIRTNKGVNIKKIIQQDSGFEIDEYISFNSIYDLINWYHKHSLPDIGMELKYPCRANKHIFNINKDKIDKDMNLSKIENESSPNFGIHNTRLDFCKAVLKEKIGNNIYRCNINGLTCVAKIFDCKNRNDFIITLDNIELLNSISKENHIVKYLHHNTVENKVILFLEYLPTTLYSVIRSRALQGKKFSPRTINSIALELIRSINKLHTHNPPIVHKNIYSSHIFVQFNSFENPVELKLSDFGNYESILDDKNKILPPELLSSILADEPLKIDCSADIYNFGMVLYEILTLKKPFAKSKNIRESILKGKIPPIPTFDERYKPIIDIIKSCLSENSNLRPTSETILKDLNKLLIY